MELITDPTIHYHDRDAECYFIGEMLSNEEESYRAFRHFVSHRSPRFILSLRGNYQSIIRISNQLWIFADLGNVRPIYYAKQKEQLLVSSHLSIIHQKVNSELHIPWLRRYLLTGGTHIESESPYEAINMISGGFGLRYKGDKVHVFQAWDVDEEPSLSWEMAQDQLKNELTQSVLLRCRNKHITSDLSGGLDSSTLTWIASKGNQVKSITIVGKEEDEDCIIAKEIVQKQSNIEQTVISQDEIPLIYSNIDKVRADAPIPFLWSANKVKAKLLWAKQNQSDIHFSGEGGDTVLGADHTYLVDLIHRRKWKTFLSHAKGWAEVKKQSPFSWIRGSIQLALRLPFTPKERHPLSPMSNHPEWLPFSTAFPKENYSIYQGVSNTIHGIQYLGHISHGLKDLSEQEQVNICFPYVDHNVIRVCMRTSSEKKMNPYELKPLLKRAFQHDLPECLLTRNTKGNYTSDVYYGMRQQFSWFQENFQQMILAEMGLVDIQKFQECFHRLSMGVPVRLPEFHQTLSLEMWLRQTKKAQDRGGTEQDAVFNS